MSSSTDRVLASPPDACCLKAVKHTGEAAGETVVIADIETYVSYPAPEAEKAHKRVVLFFADVYGPFFINGQLVMDFFASQGWLVVSPDYFRRDPITVHRKFRGDTETEPNFDFDAWKDKHLNFALENVPKWVEAVKTKYGTPDAKYATVGYCFGAPFVLGETAGEIVSCGAIAHPAFLMESHFQKSKKPLFLSCAETDQTFPAESRHIAEKILADNKQSYHFQLFSGVEHGFALRGDMSVENERWAKEESANGILRWFERFCN